jgi:hypothetical protein
VLRKLLLIVLACFPVVLLATRATALFEDAPAAKGTTAAAAAPAASPSPTPRRCQDREGYLLPPSALARPIPGAKGRCELAPGDWEPGKTTRWIDSDGVDPGTAGCHEGIHNNSNSRRNGRRFGEGCLFDNTWLIESNPGRHEPHNHVNDLGHPDLFDCNEWCTGRRRESGRCVEASSPPCAASAKCVCVPP